MSGAIDAIVPPDAPQAVLPVPRPPHPSGGAEDAPAPDQAGRPAQEPTRTVNADGTMGPHHTRAEAATTVNADGTLGPDHVPFPTGKEQVHRLDTLA